MINITVDEVEHEFIIESKTGALYTLVVYYSDPEDKDHKVIFLLFFGLIKI